MHPLLAAARHVARFGVWAGGSLMLLAAVIIGVEVLARRFAGMSLGGIDDLTGFILAIATAWALPLTLLDRAHIRVDTVYALLPRRVAAMLDLLALIALTGFFAVVAWYGWNVMTLSWRLGARPLSALAMPLWIPQLFWVFGLFLFLATALLLIVRAVMLLLRGDDGAVRALIGSRSIVEETEEELQDVHRRRDDA